MNKMLVAVFTQEAQSFEGLSALKDLDKNGDISLYSTAVIQKNMEGEVQMKDSENSGPIGTSIGFLTGSLFGMLAGPIGMLAGASVGGLTGLFFDIDKSGVDTEFTENVSKMMTPGTFAILADIQEDWTTPVDTRIEECGGVVFRQSRSEINEDRIVSMTKSLDTELAELKTELAQDNAESKAASQKQIDELKKKLKLVYESANMRLSEVTSEMEAKSDALQEKIKTASDRKKVKLEKRITELKTDLDSRVAKLEEASTIAKSAFTS